LTFFEAITFAVLVKNAKMAFLALQLPVFSVPVFGFGAIVGPSSLSFS
jgi:hypothetical protein